MIIKGRTNPSSDSSAATISLPLEFKFLLHSPSSVSCVNIPGHEKTSANTQMEKSSTLSFLLSILDHSCGLRIRKHRYKLSALTVITLEYMKNDYRQSMGAYFEVSYFLNKHTLISDFPMNLPFLAKQ